MTEEKPYKTINRFLSMCAGQGIHLADISAFARDCGCPGIYCHEMLIIAQDNEGDISNFRARFEEWQAKRIAG